VGACRRRRFMATAMGSSGMYGDSAEVRHRGLERLHQASTCSAGGAAAQRKTHAGARAFRRKADGGEDVRRSHGAAGAGRAGGNGEAAEVERDHQGLALDARRNTCWRCWRALPARALMVTPEMRPATAFSRRSREHGKPVCPRSPRLSPATSAPRRRPRCRERSQCRGGGRAHDGRRKRWARASCPAHVQGAHALGSVNLVAAHAIEIDFPRSRHPLDLAQRLHAST